jgi:hypothetical protein
MRAAGALAHEDAAPAKLEPDGGAGHEPELVADCGGKSDLPLDETLLLRVFIRTE